MDQSACFSILAAALMGLPAIWVIVAPVSAQEFCLRVLFAVLFALGIFALLVQGVFAKRERNKQELRTAARDAESAKRFDELAALLRKQQPASSSSPDQSLSLKTRTQKLADDLFAFLREQGPQPASPLSVRGGAAEQRQAFNAYFEWKGKIYRHYMAYYRDRVVQIDRELAAHSIYTTLDMREIDPPETTGEVDLRKIAETLLLKAATMQE